MYLVVLALLTTCSVFFFKQKTAYEMRISDWSSDVCSSDLYEAVPAWLTPRWAAAFTSSNVSTKHVGEAVFALMVTTPQCEQSRSSDPPRGTGARFDSRSEGRRVGKECVRTCRSRWSRDPEKKKNR